MESQTLTSATLSHSESVGSLLNERSSDALLQSPSTLRLTEYSPKLESDLPNSSDNHQEKTPVDTDKSEKIFLLPGTERVVKVIKKFTISDNNKQYTGGEDEVFFDNTNNNPDEYNLNDYHRDPFTEKTENKYYKTNISLHKRHRVSHRTERSHRERHHQHRRRQHQSHYPIVGTHSSEQSLSPVRKESKVNVKNAIYKKRSSSVLNSSTYDPNNLEQKRVVSRLDMIAPGPAESSDLNDINGVVSNDGFPVTSQNMQSYLASQNKSMNSSDFKQSRLFLPIGNRSSGINNNNKYRHRSQQHECKYHYEHPHSSLNRLYSHVSFDSSICRKCHNVICSRCNEGIHHHHHYDLNRNHSQSRPVHRADIYCNQRLHDVSCSDSLDHHICQLNSNRKSKSLSNSKLLLPSGHHHHYHWQPHKLLSYSKSIPSLSTLDLYGTNSSYFNSLNLDSNRHINFMEIEYMQMENNSNDENDDNHDHHHHHHEGHSMHFSTEKLHWITNLARESLIKTKDLDLLAKLMKETLDEHFGKLWHTIVGTESYGSNLATLPGALISFRVDKWAFLIWQT
ncbi:Dynein light chain type 1 2 [Schistosoma japonicum]|uniref:Dynein light chain type 1 2 n=1 Tax=Schistosoma japonicum TaxID=6182 RepID=A0A4Z2D710_SCHJA|nr:Dynein light chain type 1 2 [Schistosoma japonicum]TNN12229.1 Dynein light chain type 1 2 [Schistosoma japonicum]TNN12230.1 Dynein light chain type 1 2 [Schistosoma japonicum]